MTRAWLLVSLALVGCATTTTDAPPIVPAPVPTVEAPLPQPASVDAIPSGAMPQDEILRLMASDPTIDVSPKESRSAVKAANAQAVIRPRRGDIKRAVVIYPVVDGGIYEVLTAVDRPTDLVFSHPEAVVEVNKSDALWDVVVKTVGDEPNRQFHVVITPKGPGLQTTMLVLTNLSAYYLQVDSLPEGQSGQMMAIRWKHPAMPRALPKLLNPGLYYTGYDTQLVSGAAEFLPEAVWDTGLDGKTLIKLPARVQVGELPVFHVLGNDGKTQLTNPQRRGDWLVITRLVTRAELRVGHADGASVVRISRGASYRPVWCPSPVETCRRRPLMRAGGYPPVGPRDLLSKQMIIVICVCAVLALVGFLTSPLWWPSSAAPAETRREVAPPRPKSQEPPVKYTSEPLPDQTVPVTDSVENHAAPSASDDDVHMQLLTQTKRTADSIETLVEILSRQQEAEQAKTQQTQAKPAPEPKLSVQERRQHEKELQKEVEEAKKKKLDAMKAKKYEWVKPEDSDKADAPGRVHQLKTPWSLTPNTTINFVTYAKVTNESPGAFVAFVSEDVKDSATQTIVVIPQGMALGLQPSGKTILGDERLPIEALKASHRGKWLDLPKTSIGDRAGTAGFADQINRHWGRIIGSVLFTGVLKGGSSLFTAVGQDTPAKLGGALGMEATQQGQRQVQQFIRTDPTMTIRPAYQGSLLLLEALELNEPLT